MYKICKNSTLINIMYSLSHPSTVLKKQIKQKSKKSILQYIKCSGSNRGQFNLMHIFWNTENDA